MQEGLPSRAESIDNMAAIHENWRPLDMKPSHSQTFRSVGLVSPDDIDMKKTSVSLNMSLMGHRSRRDLRVVG